MRARLIVHEAGSSHITGRELIASSITLTATAGCEPPTLSFTTATTDAPRPRLDQVTLLVDDIPVETVFTTTTTAHTMIAGKDFGTTTVNCVGIMMHLDEIVNTAGWPATSFTDLGDSIRNIVLNNDRFQRCSGLTPASFQTLVLERTGDSAIPSDIIVPVPPVPSDKSIDDYSQELQTFLAVCKRYALEEARPLDWYIDTTRRLRVTSPIRTSAYSIRTIIAGSNVDEITESVDLSTGRIASEVYSGTLANHHVAKLRSIEAEYGTIEQVAVSGSAASIVTSLSSRYRVFSISSGQDNTQIVNGRPNLWIGDRVRIETYDGRQALCAVTSATLTVSDGGNHASLTVGASEGTW